MSPGYSSILGVFLVALGALMGLLAFIRYKRTEKQIDEETFRPSILLDVLLTIAILSVGVFLVFVLIHSM
jgi:putative membrane protein